MHHLARMESVFEHVVGRGKRGVDVAVPQLELEVQVRVPAAFQMLEIGKHAGRPENVVHDRR